MYRERLIEYLLFYLTVNGKVDKYPQGIIEKKFAMRV